MTKRLIRMSSKRNLSEQQLKSRLKFAGIDFERVHSGQTNLFQKAIRFLLELALDYLAILYSFFFSLDQCLLRLLAPSAMDV